MNGTLDDILEVVRTISTSDFRKLSKEDISILKFFVRSDGCTGVPDTYVQTCVVHDFNYRTHHDLSGMIISRSQADRNFRLHNQHCSEWGKLSPLSWVRWLGVRCFGYFAWRKLRAYHG